MKRDVRTGVVAEALGVSAASVQAYARSGRIPFRKTPGGQYRYNLDEVREVLGLSQAITPRDDLVSLFDAETGRVIVDELSAYRPDPIDADALRRDRVRGVRLSPSRPREEVEANSGADELGRLVEGSHRAGGVVLHREPVGA